MPKPTKTKTAALEVISMGGTHSTASHFNEAETAQHITEAYDAANDAFHDSLRKVVVCGMLLLEARKHGEETDTIKHGQFLPWLARNCPNIPQRTAYRWMDLSGGILEHLEICHGGKFDNLPLPVILQLAPSDLSPDQRAIQQKVFALLDGKSQKQLLLEFRDPDPDPAGGFRPNKSDLKKWLAKHHPEIDSSTPFSGLTGEVQKEFRAWMKKHGKSMDPKKAAAARLADLLERLQDTIAVLGTWTREDLSEISDEDPAALELALDASITFNNTIRALKKTSAKDKKK